MSLLRFFSKNAKDEIDTKAEIKVGTVSATTNANGTVTLGLSGSHIDILNIVETGKGYRCVPVFAGNAWYANVWDTLNASVVVAQNTSCVFKYWYVEK